MLSYCPRCGRIVQPGHRCGERDRDRMRRATEPWRGAYHDHAYLAARQRVIERQGGRCADCGKICAEKVGGTWRTRRLGGEVDHETRLADGGDSMDAHMALRCRSCHRKADARRRGQRTS